MEYLMKDNPDNFVREQDCEDLEDHMIEASMCVGNLLARRNCLVEGSFGYGARFETAEI